ncbi:unnamed protein product [Bemisia tabaci]|uniref:MICOS complex subunit MIC10 n=1 Tax=Bemisia tabaci TaxID=7038 RepID=A0A9P0A7V7_BEMTA|nr:unnamed protein product [Bemisia tabaci]
MAKPAHPVLSEEELGKQWDKCIYNGMVKMGGGLAVGLVASLLIYKSKGCQRVNIFLLVSKFTLAAYNISSMEKKDLTGQGCGLPYLHVVTSCK